MGFRLTSFGRVKKKPVKEKRKRVVKRKRKKVVKENVKVVKRKKDLTDTEKRNSLQKVFVMLENGKNFKNKCQDKVTVKEK